jgi:Excreted virulence factor EspC, type VII ESX diderm
VTNLSVEPSRLISAADTVSMVADRVEKNPARGYEVRPTEVGSAPLAAALDVLQHECQRAVTALVADLTATGQGLLATATRYVVTDETAAGVFTALGDRQQADQP